MILPFLLLLLGALYLARQHDRGAPAVPPLTVDPEASVAALRGELAGARGDWLIATLVPLHNDPSRQAFEAAALSRRLELGPGEPWRLSVRWSVPESARGSDSSGTRAARGSEAIAQVAPQGIALGWVEVRDTGGPALSSIPGQMRAASASAAGSRCSSQNGHVRQRSGRAE